MPSTRFDWIVIALASAFVVALAILLVPTFVADNLDLVHAFDQALINPYATGFATDLLFTYLILFAWVVYEANYRDVRHGWVALVLGLLVGVSVGLATYLLIRHREIGPQTWR
jgi:hypothetical protein